MIVAIDGPAGSGKSSTARAVAERLGFQHLDSGALYRALTLAALSVSIPEDRWAALEVADIAALGVTAEFRDGVLCTLRHGRVIEDEALRGDEITARVSAMARVPAVREWLLSRQRDLARGADVVVDGRDIGTVVFPDAELKVYLDARPEVRAERRLLQRGEPASADRQVRREAARLKARDRTDAGRAIAPLRQAPDAVLLDTSDLDFKEQVDAIVALARAALRRGSGGAPS